MTRSPEYKSLAAAIHDSQGVLPAKPQSHYCAHIELSDCSQTLRERLNSRRGPLIEVAGPTPSGYTILGAMTLPHIITTAYPAAPNIPSIVDARHLPFEPKSVGALLTSYLPECDPRDYTDLRAAFIEQASTCIEDEGLLIMQGGRQRDLTYASQAGFIILHAALVNRQQAIAKQWDFIAIRKDYHTAGYLVCSAT